MSNLLFRRLCLSARMPGIRLSTTSKTTTATESEDYFEKNTRLNRPISPFTIYKPQVTTVLSITHRMTGLYLSVLLYGGGIAALASSQTNFPQALQSVQGSVSPSVLLAIKILAGIQVLDYL